MEETLSSSASRTFDLSDVAETAGPKMANNGLMQSEMVRSNVVSLIEPKQHLKSYIPIPEEGVLKLSLGEEGNVFPISFE